MLKEYNLAQAIKKDSDRQGERVVERLHTAREHGGDYTQMTVEVGQNVFRQFNLHSATTVVSHGGIAVTAAENGQPKTSSYGLHQLRGLYTSNELPEAAKLSERKAATPALV